jgi:hypothetical protein
MNGYQSTSGYQPTSGAQPTSGTQPTDGSLPSVRSPIAVKADNLIRRILRVSNPNDPNEIADGLLRHFMGAAREQQLEEAGLPFYRVQTVEVGPRPDGDPAMVEATQARSDVDRDLDSLLHNAVLKNIQPELRGWLSAIDGIIADASQTARFALDPRQRDKTYASRRLLGDYARVARFVGAMTPSLNSDYRALAKSLDEVASVLLVTMGDAIANIGFGGGRFLLQAPASELQERREAVLAALRNLNGSVQTSYNQSTWPWGLDALRRILTRLDANGHSDLRTLFQENTVAQIMDDLIARASTPGADGLRALGSTAPFSLQQLRRLVSVAQNVDPESPPLAAYLDAIMLFIEGFRRGSSGSRLLFIARPPIVFYGLYGIGGPDDATRILIQLVTARGLLADLIDCVLECACTQSDITWQIILDKVLYDIDRAIDYFSLGTDPQGLLEPEWRARAFGYVIHYLLTNPDNLAIFDLHRMPNPRPPKPNPLVLPDPFVLSSPPTENPLRNRLTEIRNLLGVPTLPFDNNLRAVMNSELCMQDDAEQQWESLLQTMAPSCHRPADLLGAVHQILTRTRVLFGLGDPCVEPDVSIPPTLETSLAGRVFGRFSEGRQP